jgi:hypothetical protein
LDCGSPLPLSVASDVQSGRGLPQSKTLARQMKLFPPRVFYASIEINISNL